MNFNHDFYQQVGSLDLNQSTLFASQLQEDQWANTAPIPGGGQDRLPCTIGFKKFCEHNCQCF